MLEFRGIFTITFYFSFTNDLTPFICCSNPTYFFLLFRKLRPYPISIRRFLSPYIDKPDWADDVICLEPFFISMSSITIFPRWLIVFSTSNSQGIPKTEPYSDLQHVIEVRMYTIGAQVKIVIYLV